MFIARPMSRITFCPLALSTFLAFSFLLPLSVNMPLCDTLPTKHCSCPQKNDAAQHPYEPPHANRTVSAFLYVPDISESDDQILDIK